MILHLREGVVCPVVIINGDVINRGEIALILEGRERLFGSEGRG